MTKRRSFIQQLAGTAMGSFILSSIPIRVEGKENFREKLNETKTDEEFWKVVRNQFPLTKKRTYFNTATVGPSP